MGQSLVFASSIHRTAAIAHAVATGYLLINGVGHQAGVLWKARAGTLAGRHSLSELLAIGAALIVMGGLFSISLAPLLSATRPNVVPALACVVALAAVVITIGMRFGVMFPGTVSLLTVVDGVAPRARDSDAADRVMTGFGPAH